MNTEKIQNAISILKDILEEEAVEPPIAVSLSLTKRELAVLVEITRTNITVPQAVANYSTHVTYSEARHVLDVIKGVVDIVR